MVAEAKVTQPMMREQCKGSPYEWTIEQINIIQKTKLNSFDYEILEAMQGVCDEETNKSIEKTLRKRRREVKIYKFYWKLHLFFLRVKGLIVNIKWKLWLMLMK